MENTIKETTRLLLNGTLTKDEADKILLDLFGVSGRSEQLKPKFNIGQKIIVCGELETSITRIDGENYYFLDESGKEWSEVEGAIEAK